VGPEALYIAGVVFILVAAAVTYPTLLVITAPYGRHQRQGFGPTLPARLVWVIQESPSVLLFALIFFLSDASAQTAPLVLFLLWQAHYVQRTFIFPFLMRLRGKRDPALTMGLALLFNLINASINAYAITHGAAAQQPGWLLDPRFLLGAALFGAGYVINRHSDHILRTLRRPGEDGYKIPNGGLFRYVTSPNYLGELIEWTGWAIATWSLGGLAFALFTAANLVPRARSHHQWYHRTFSDYPPHRRIIFPGLY
jgi:steroid 5-alpha-reductase/3-oxo-5-alpha-steroid 4-dehydrogenase 1